MIHLSYEQEITLIQRLVMAQGVSAEDAASLAAVVTHSDFTGTYSHGLSRLCIYLRQYMAGALVAQPDFRCVKDAEASLAFDCGGGSGIVAVNRVYDAVLERARKFGVAAGVGRNSANIGCGGYYGHRMAEDNVIGIVVSNTYPCMAPYGGADRLIGTNPIVVGIPTGEEYPMVLDISTTNVAMGKIQAAQREGQSIPLGWANDYDGRPTTDPAQAYALTSIAAHKGYGLAVMVDALSTLLSGACYGTDVGLFSKLEKENTGFFLLLIDPSRFMPIEDFKRSADRYIRMVKASRKAEGVDEIFLPGEIERKKFKEFMMTGIEVSEALQAELTQLSRKLGVDFAGDSFPDLLRHFCG